MQRSHHAHAPTLAAFHPSTFAAGLQLVCGRASIRRLNVQAIDKSLMSDRRALPERAHCMGAGSELIRIFNRVNFKDVNNNTGDVLFLDQLGITDVRVRGSADKAASSFGGFMPA